MERATELHERLSVRKGSVYIKDTDKEMLEKLSSLKVHKHFIIQKKTSIDYFTMSNVTHEIMDPRKNILFRATRPRSLFLKKPKNKILVKNLRNVELFRIAIEPTSNLDAINTAEATIYVYPKRKVAKVEIYGGVYSQRSYEIFNYEGQTAFTIDPVVKKTGNSAITEYNVSTKKGSFASIMMKTGLNCILSTDECATVFEKLTLIAVLLGMDLLKSRSRDKDPLKNQYLLH
ncbi:unnamed protein product [Orchesella dallaii]|uniref:Uncharacterized protein n=1 Tax=Orchesella dallaii TaxID=48710 RepID=A0ABP1RDU0_9HEXA